VGVQIGINSTARLCFLLLAARGLVALSAAALVHSLLAVLDKAANTRATPDHSSYIAFGD